MSLRRFSSCGAPGLIALFAVGCTGHPEVDDASGAGGSGAGSGGSAGSAGQDGDACQQVGSGSIQMVIEGLPEGLDAGLILTGPRGSQAVESSTLLEGLSAGPYVVEPVRVAAPDPIVRTVYQYSGTETAACLESGATLSITVSYVTVPSSHRLWTNNSGGTGNLLGFSGDDLDTTASAEPDVAAVAGAGKDVAFDAQGNLWSMGATLADPHLMRFAWSDLGVSGEKVPAQTIDVAGIECLPALRAFAFGPEGSLWVSTCGGRVVKLGAPELERTGEITPPVVLSGLEDNGDVAFDILGNLWVTDGDRIVRYDAEHLYASSEEPPELSMAVQSGPGGADLAPSNLAFDAAGNLWVVDFGGNLLSKVAADDLAGTGETSAVAETTLALSVSALLERPAFDEGGGLWLALDQNRFGRLSPEQLTQSTTAGDPTTPERIITSPSMGNANRMAFYPAAPDLPIYHRWR